MILGTTDTAGNSIADAFAEKDRYLGIKVDDGAELAPRQQILSAPFAVVASQAEHANKADVAETVEGTNLYIDANSGNIGIGVANPSEKLEVNGIAKITGGLKPDYDSGWFAEDNLSHHVKTIEHNLGVYPSRVQIWFSEDNPPTGYIITVPLTTYDQPSFLGY